MGIKPSAYGDSLFRIQLDDLHFVNRNIDHFAGRTLFYNTFECLKISLDPFRSQTAACNLYDVFISLRGFLSLFDFDGITSAYKVRRDIYLFAVNQNVFVVNDLTCFFSGSSHSHTEQNVVQTELKKDHQVLTSLSFHSVSLFVIVNKRFLQTP